MNENLTLRKALSHSNINEKSIDTLIKTSRMSHEKKGIGCDKNNVSTSTSSSHSIAHPRLSTNIPTRALKSKPLRKTN